MAGNRFTQNNPTNVTLTLTNSATLTWIWQTQYRLTTAVSGSGTVTPGGWMASGASVVLTATAGSSAHFVRWSGTTNGCLIAGNVLTAPMTLARSITATFAAGAQPVISGKITRSGTSTGVTNVLLTFSNSGGTATTDSSGNYSKIVPYNWTGTVTPSSGTGGTFSPVSKAYSRVTLNTTLQNYTWTTPAARPVPASTLVASTAITPAAPVVLLRTSGSVRWSGAAAIQAWQAPELLQITVEGGETQVVLPGSMAAPDALDATIAVEPTLLEMRELPEPAVLVIRNQNGFATADTSLPNARILDTVTILSVGDSVVLTWDFTILGP